MKDFSEIIKEGAFDDDLAKQAVDIDFYEYFGKLHGARGYEKDQNYIDSINNYFLNKYKRKIDNCISHYNKKLGYGDYDKPIDKLGRPLKEGDIIYVYKPGHSGYAGSDDFCDFGIYLGFAGAVFYLSSAKLRGYASDKNPVERIWPEYVFKLDSFKEIK